MGASTLVGWLADGFWQAFASTAYQVTHLVTGGRIMRIDEGGASHLKGKAPVIVAPNHLGNADGGIVAMSLPRRRRRRIRLIADHTSVSLWADAGDPRTRMWHWVLLTLTMKPYRAIVVRGDLRGADAVAAIVDAVRAGDTILIFPEGDFGSADALQPLRAGVASVALATGAVVLPIRIDGTARAMPTLGRLRTRPQVTARFRPAIVAQPGDDEAALLERLAQTLSPDPAVRAQVEGGAGRGQFTP